MILETSSPRRTFAKRRMAMMAHPVPALISLGAFLAVVPG
jgi:hypothetical protein